MGVLLKAEGVQLIKRAVFDIANFVQGELIIRDSAKDLKELSICFHEERNVLKQQVRLVSYHV